MNVRNSILNRLASIELTLFCIGLAMTLVIWGTVAQVSLGTFEAQKVFFNSWVIYARPFHIPVFPGGLSVGLLWLIALVAFFIKRFRLNKKDIGLVITHSGLICLLVGQLATQLLSRESQLPIAIGQSKNYSEDFRNSELVFIDTSDPALDTVTSIPESIYSQGEEIRAPALPFQVLIHQYFRNSELGMLAAGIPTPVNQGIGTRVAVRPIPPATDDGTNTPSAFMEIRKGPTSYGTWLVSSGLGAPQSFAMDGRTYRIAIRPKRTYYPFTLSLLEFRHDQYPGTNIPKNFSSLIRLTHPAKNEQRQVLIYMNHPLRYEGKTFYQASFGEGDRVSVLQVVENPASIAPYIFCAMVILGLLIQFIKRLVAFSRKPK